MLRRVQCEDFVGVGGEVSDLLATQQKEYQVTHSHSLALSFYPQVPPFLSATALAHAYADAFVYTQALEAQVDRLNAAILRLDETLLLVSDATAIDRIEDAKCKGIGSF